MFLRVNSLFSCFLLSIVANCPGELALLKIRSFTEAQCTAKCLQSFALKVNAAADEYKNDTLLVSLRRTLVERPDLMLAQCTKKTTLFPFCRSCVMKGCKANSRTMGCTDACKGNNGCHTGCKYLLEVTRNRPGSCPKDRPTPIHKDCSSLCRMDSDCRVALHKCCRSGCYSRCSAPVYNASIPKLDKPIRIWEHTKLRRIELVWRIEGQKYSPTDYLNPMVFVAQIRDYTGRVFDDRLSNPWATLAISTKNGASLDEVEVGTWYQFRIASVTASGTRGFLQMSTPVKLSVKPRPPTAPRNVSDGVWRIHAGGSIHVQINWSPPKICDFIIFRYQVEWVQDHGYVQSDGKSLEALTRFRQYVPGDRTSYTIENLMPSTSYKVQVTAVGRWGDVVENSPPNTLFITTPDMWNPQDASRGQAGNGNKLSTGEDGRCVCDKKTPGLFIYKPIYRNGSLTVKVLLTKTTTGEDKPYLVEWSPKVCIATSEEARTHKISGRMKSTMQQRVKVIKDLAFNCRYWLRLSPLENPNPRETISTCFCTPSCRDVHVDKKTRPPRCSPDNSLPVPSRPTNINARKVGRQEFALSWARPKRERHFNRFRVVWGPREEEPVNKDMYGDSGLSPKIDFNLAETKVVSNNVTSLRLKNLRDATMYIVKIQALTYRDGKESESPEGVLYFTTDGFTNPPTVQDYQVVRQYVKDGRPNGISSLAPPARSLFLLLHFLLLSFLRDFT